MLGEVYIVVSVESGACQRAIASGGSAGCLTSCLTSRFTSRMSLQLPCFVSCVWFCLFWGLFWGFASCLSRGALVDFFLTRSSRDMTATVLSNAALEKKNRAKNSS